eukprot:12280739-Alexandrium_andersonii.AAC.1
MEQRWSWSAPLDCHCALTLAGPEAQTHPLRATLPPESAALGLGHLDNSTRTAAHEVALSRLKRF